MSKQPPSDLIAELAEVSNRGDLAQIYLRHLCLRARNRIVALEAEGFTESPEPVRVDPLNYQGVIDDINAWRSKDVTAINFLSLHAETIIQAMQSALHAPAEQALKVGDRVELNFCDSSRSVIHIRKVETIYRLNADGVDMAAPYSSDELRAVPTKPAEQAGRKWADVLEEGGHCLDDCQHCAPPAEITEEQRIAGKHAYLLDEPAPPTDQE